MRALSGEAEFLRALRTAAFRGRVHSVFPRAVNIEAADGTLRTLATRDLGDAPDTLVVDASDFVRMGIVSGDVAATHGGVLVIGTQWTIRLDDATPWDPALPPYPDDDSRLRRNLALVAARTYARAHRIEGEMPYRARPCSKLAAQASALLGRHATMLRAALCRGDLAAACEHGRAMLGLGPGLTPSGDDFLVGFFAVLHIARGPGGHCAGICADIVSDAEGHTNAISVAALRAAARGRVRASIVALVQALLDGSANEVSRALTPVLAIGSTSGADIVAGIVSGFEVQLHAGGRTKRAPARMRRPRIGATAAMVGASDRMIDTTGGPGWKAHSSFLAA